MFLKPVLLLIALFVSACSHKNIKEYPEYWWKSVPKSEAKWWEILPQEAQPGEVILSKRNELGTLSHFAHTPFEFDGKKYQSVEGFWQMLKFPENKEDPRFSFIGIHWDMSREQVAQLYSFEAKRVGKIADENMDKMGINWVSYKGKKMPYRESQKGELYQLIKKVMWAKLQQNKKVEEVLLQTEGLQLRPDFKMKADEPPVFLYHIMWMEIRDELLKKKTP